MRLPLFFIAVAVALTVSGCGGGGGGGSSAPTTSTAASSTPHAEAGASAPLPDAASAQGRGSSSDDEGSRAGAGRSSPAGERDPGGGVAQFEHKGADDSIQESGSEASATEQRAASAALHGYLDARAASDWARACSHMAAGVLSSVSRAGGEKDVSCAESLAALSAGTPPAALREAAIARVGAFRLEGAGGYLLFHGSHGAGYFMPMAREGSAWKVAAIAASQLP